MATVKVREAIRRLEADGWYYVGTEGGHRQYKHFVRLGKVTVPGKLSATLPVGTWLSIQRQAGWR